MVHRVPMESALRVIFRRAIQAQGNGSAHSVGGSLAFLSPRPVLGDHFLDLGQRRPMGENGCGTGKLWKKWLRAWNVPIGAVHFSSLWTELLGHSPTDTGAWSEVTYQRLFPEVLI